MDGGKMTQALEGFEVCVASKPVIRRLCSKVGVVEVIGVGGRVALLVACGCGLMQCHEGARSIHQGGVVVGPIHQGIVVGGPADHIPGQMHGSEKVAGEHEIVLGPRHKELGWHKGQVCGVEGALEPVIAPLPHHHEPGGWLLGFHPSLERLQRLHQGVVKKNVRVGIGDEGHRLWALSLHVLYERLKDGGAKGVGLYAAGVEDAVGRVASIEPHPGG